MLSVVDSTLPTLNTTVTWQIAVVVALTVALVTGGCLLSRKTRHGMKEMPLHSLHSHNFPQRGNASNINCTWNFNIVV